MVGESRISALARAEEYFKMAKCEEESIRGG
jgi:hypothetical protein